MDPKLKTPIINEEEQEEALNEQDNIEPSKDKKEKGYKEGLHDDTTITNADDNNKLPLDDAEAGKVVNEEE